MRSRLQRLDKQLRYRNAAFQVQQVRISSLTIVCFYLDSFFSFDWYISDGQDHYMPHLAMQMLIDLAKDSFTDISQMVKFILTVKKSYHNHPYHNFKHAFNVMHCIYNILKRNLDTFDEIEVPHRFRHEAVEFHR